MQHQGETTNSNGKSKGQLVFTVLVQILTLLVIPYAVWTTTGIYELREWRALSMKINTDQDGKLACNERSIAAVVDKMVPVALTTQVGEMRDDVKQLQKQVSELTGMMREHIREGRLPG